MTTSLITGATGFIGTVLAERLRARGERVVALVRKSSDTRALQRMGVEPQVGDMLDTASLRQAMAGTDVIYHLASLLKMPWKRAFVSANVDGCADVARAAAEQPCPPRLVVVSSMAAAGPAPLDRPRREDDVAQPVSLYGRVKLAGEQAARCYADRVPTSIVRPPMVFGPGDRSSLPLFRAASRGLRLSTPGAAQVAMIHVADLADMLIAVAERGERVKESTSTQNKSDAIAAAGEDNGAMAATRSDDGAIGRGIYQVAHTTQPSSAMLGQLLAEACGHQQLRTIPIPRAVLVATAGMSELWGRLRDRPASLNLDKVRELTAPSWAVSLDKLHHQLAFHPTPLRQRLAETTQSYRDQGLIR